MELEIEIQARHYRMRPIGPTDDALILAGFEALSEEARRHRFLVATPRLSKSQLHYLTTVDQRDHVAIGLLEAGGTPVAVGRFIRLDDDSDGADVAITVVDSHQRRGLGSFLLGVLAVAAVERGIGLLHFDVLAENAGMLGLLEGVGAQRTSAGSMVHLTVPPGAVPAPAEARRISRIVGLAAWQYAQQSLQPADERRLCGVE